MTYNIIDCHYC